MRTLSIDIETFSSTDLFSAGVYKYVEAPDFEVLLIAYAYDGGDVGVIDLTAENIEPQLLANLTDPAIIKTAYNAAFERTCLAKHFGIPMPPEQWQCTMVKAAMAGYPMGLEAVAKAMKLDQQKDASGKALIRFFSIPCKPTAKNGMRTRNLPQHDPFRWEDFKAYCVQDVRTEMAILDRLSWFTMPESESRLWGLDQRINDRGVLVDTAFVEAAISIGNQHRENLIREAIELTGLDNPNSAAQLKEWLEEQTGEAVTTLTKQTVPELLKVTDCEVTTRVLEIRQELAKTSVKKYDAMRACVCADGRIRGLLQFYGATRTGRWAGRLVQVQNLPQNHLEDLDLARRIVRAGDRETLELLFGNVPDTLSQLIRTAFVAPNGRTFAVADFSAIEARVIAWLAGEKWRIDVFNTHGKIYEASAAQMFKVPLESIGKGSPLRQKGKVAELALGYQGGTNALIAMGALRMGIAEEELPGIVAAWRKANPAIVRLWADVEEFAKGATIAMPKFLKGLKFETKHGALVITLPSGRELYYQNARLKPGRYGEVITYDGMNQTTKQWGPQETYGGKLVENIVQAIARDCLAESLLRLDEALYDIVMHVHDEVVIELPLDIAGHGLSLCETIMAEPISWAPGLPLKADGYITEYYKKD